MKRIRANTNAAGESTSGKSVRKRSTSRCNNSRRGNGARDCCARTLLTTVQHAENPPSALLTVAAALWATLSYISGPTEHMGREKEPLTHAHCSSSAVHLQRTMRGSIRMRIRHVAWDSMSQPVKKRRRSAGGKCICIG